MSNAKLKKSSPITLDQHFCTRLEYALSRALATTRNADWQGFWCDGVLPDAELETTETQQVLTASIFLGKTGQDRYQLRLVSSDKTLKFTADTPLPEGQKAEKWLTVDIDSRLVTVNVDCPPVFRLPTGNEQWVHLATDYGADEYLWYFPSAELADLLAWWEAQTDLTVFEKHPERLIGDITLVKTDDEYEFLYGLTVPKIVLLDYRCGSYLIYADNGVKNKLCKV